MSLRALANSCIVVTNPDVSATLRQSTGATVNADYSRTPTYSETTGPVQVQALSGEDLRHLEGLSEGKVLQKVYLDGRWESVVRADLKGGDLFTFAYNGAEHVWLVVQVLERWQDWVAVAVAMQTDGV